MVGTVPRKGRGSSAVSDREGTVEIHSHPQVLVGVLAAVPKQAKRTTLDVVLPPLLYWVESIDGNRPQMNHQPS